MANGIANQRRLLWTTIAAAIATPLLVLGAIFTMEGIHTSALKWLDASTPERAAYERFSHQFEGGTFVLLTWDDCTLTDPRLAKLEAALTPDPDEENPLVARVLSGRSLYEQLTEPKLRLTSEQALQRLQGSLIGGDGESTCLITVLTEHGARERAESIHHLKHSALEAAALEDEEIYLAGPTVDALAIDIESNRTVDYFAPPSALVSFLFCWWCLRSLRFSLAILAVAGFGELMVLGSLYYFGITMDAVLIVLPPLVFVLTVSSGIHLVNYYFDQVRIGAGDDAPRIAVLHGWLPCSLAALTTAIGLGSLMVSRIVPVSTFGQFAAGGVVASVILLFLVLPGVMSRWPMSRQAVASGEESSLAVVQLVRMADFVCHHASLITLAGIVGLAAGFVGLTHLRTSIGVNELFSPNSRIVRDFDWIEQNVANLVPLEIVVTFPADAEMRMIDRLAVISQVETAVRNVDSVGGALSVASFCPEVPRTRGSRGVAARAQFNAHLEADKQRLYKTNYLTDTDAGQAWRISARVPGASGLDYEGVLRKLRAVVEPALDDAAELFEVRGSAAYTGVMPLVHHAQHALLEDMYASMLLAFVLVWLVISYVLSDTSGGWLVTPWALTKGLWLGALAMMPNVFPVVVVFGLMGWLGWEADIGSTMTACVALGIAVDDTLHFLAWYRRETAAGDSSTLAISHAFQHCGRAMIQTTLICGFGMLMFGLSDFMPTKRFSVLMFTLLTAALVADLIFLPAILASPLGRVFVKKPVGAVG